MIRYLRLLAASVFVLMAAIVAFTVAVDPYDVVGTPTRSGFNAVKHGIGRHARTTKAYAVRHVQPQTVIFGSSRAESAFNPGHAGFAARPVYNLAFPAASLYEILRYFQHVTEVAPVREALVSLDFGMFDAARAKPTWDFDEKRLAVDADGHLQPLAWRDLAGLIVSGDALRDSLWSLRHQNRTLNTYGRDGLRDEAADIPEILNKHGGHRKTFIGNEKGFACLFADSRDHFSFTDPVRGIDTLDIVRRLAQRARQKGVRLTLLIAPVHARHLEVIEQSGLGPTFAEWKRRLAAVAEAEHVALWDFAQVNSVTTEPVPLLGDQQTIMRWFRESSHARGNAGEYALNRIYEVGPQIADYGRRLDGSDLNTVLPVDRAALENWRRGHGEDMREIATLFSRCGMTKAEAD
ncbi:MAG: hypothetical protein EG825_06150 [Rhodocyclaceae bacterium]|nr:hypothetical protein [Rhodocyclaceae bacterium]